MNALLFALLSYVGWGAGDIFGAVASRKIGGYKTTFWIMTAGAILFAPLAFLLRHTLLTAPIGIIMLAILIGFFYMSGNFAVNEALRRANASIVLTINGSFGALVVLFSILFLHESLTPLIGSIIVLIFIGIFLCTYQSHTIIKRYEMSGIWYALYASISFGLFFTAVKFFTPTLGWFWPIYLSFFWLPFIYIYMRNTTNAPLFNDVKISAIPLLCNFVLLRGGDFAFNIGLQQGLAAVVAPIGGSYPTLSVILAFLVFHEKPTGRQLFGIALALCGIVALSIMSS
jgi:drug/metabolite transporter (DMT)-like permease